LTLHVSERNSDRYMKKNVNSDNSSNRMSEELLCGLYSAVVSHTYTVTYGTK